MSTAGFLKKVQKVGAYLAKIGALTASAVTISAGISLAGPEVSIKIAPPAPARTASLTPEQTKKVDCQELTSLAGRYNNVAPLPDVSKWVEKINKAEINEKLQNALTSVSEQTSGTPEEISAFNQIKETLEQAATKIQKQQERYQTAQGRLGAQPNLEECMQDQTAMRDYITQKMEMAGSVETTLETLATLQAQFKRGDYLEPNSNWTETDIKILEVAGEISGILGTDAIKGNYIDRFATVLPSHIDRGFDFFELESEKEISNLISRIQNAQRGLHSLDR